MTAIETENLTKRYGDKTVVDHLNLSVEEGELFALLGVNGAGKSTTIKMLSCLTPPTEGDAHLLGNSILTSPIAVKSELGISPQETAVAPNLTVWENLCFMAQIHGSNRIQARKAAEEILNSLELSTKKDEKAKTLSGGWQRRLSIAMALVSSPKLLFLDEPTLGLDVLARRELWRTIRALKGKVTMILTTHYLEEAEALSDRIGIMAGGRLQAVGTAGQLMERTRQESFEEAFVQLAGEEEVKQ